MDYGTFDQSVKVKAKMETLVKMSMQLGKLFFQHSLTFGVGIGVISVFALLKKLGIIYRLRHDVDRTSKKNGGDLVAEVLSAHGVKFIFALSGGHISPILVGCEKTGIKVVDTRHEATTVFAADAVARLSGNIGVAVVTAGPGLTNTVTAVKNAQMAESPVLLMGGAAATVLKGRGALQDIDQMSLFKPLCKYCVTVTHVRYIVPILRKAIQIAQSDTPGPVFVEFPIDTLYPFHLVSKEFGSSGGGTGLVPKIIAWYLNNHVDDLFAGAWEPVELTPLTVSQPMPSSIDVRRCAQLITKAKKPVILLGSQVVLPPTPVEKLVTALETIGIPCFLGGMSRGMLGRNSPLLIRQKRRDALKEADLVILAGTVCDFRLGYGRVLNRKSKIIAVNRNKDQLHKNSGVFWKPTVAVQADAATFLTQVTRFLDGFEVDENWLQTLQARDEEKEADTKKMAKNPTDIHLNPLDVLLKLEDVMDDNSIIVADGGDFVGSAAYILRPRGPLRWLDPGAFGTLGVGGGFALGAKLCRPDSEVWIVYGDGSLGYSIAEFDTFTRHNVPVLALVGNDACWSQISRDQVPLLGSNVACELAFTDYHIVAEGYGGSGYRIDRSNENKLVDILKAAREDCRQGKSVLINVLIGKTKFREGSISV